MESKNKDVNKQAAEKKKELLKKAKELLKERSIDWKEYQRLQKHLRRVE